MRCSIIVCTKDRPSHLAACLDSINSSRPIYEYHELIVVDSSTNEDTKAFDNELTKKYNGKYIFESRKGLSLARNIGIKKSSGDIVIFADDDFIVQPDWIKNIIKNFNEKDVMCCTGRMLSYRYDNTSDIFERSMSFDRGDKKIIFNKSDISILALFNTIPLIGNKRLFDRTPVPWSIGHGFCSFRKDIFNKIGYFDLNLGIGTPSLGGEEIDLFYRILKEDYKIIYDPKSIIYHNHRQTWDAALKAAYFAGASTKSFTFKYFMNDKYMTSCYIGAIFLNGFAYLRAMIGSDKSLKLMIEQELKGLFHNPKLEIKKHMY